MNNVRFATSLHILTLLATAGSELLSSEYIAGSVNVNAAIVRKALSNLREHGMVDTKEGKNGGSCLAKPANKISLADVYKSIQAENLLGRVNIPNPECPIGKNVNKYFNKVNAAAEQAFFPGNAERFCKCLPAVFFVQTASCFKHCYFNAVHRIFMNHLIDPRIACVDLVHLLLHVLADLIFFETPLVFFSFYLIRYSRRMKTDVNKNFGY
ncbi:MAG: transcriptional regulator [Sphingobacteriales bacterium]|nr:MAG: transcriptional regulator [Sphingobacteriales bacterium]